MQTPLISPTDIPEADRSLLLYPGQAKREPGSHKGRRLYLLRSRIRLRFSGMTEAAIGWRKWRTLLSWPPALAADPLEMKQAEDALSAASGSEFLSRRRASHVLLFGKRGSPGFTLMEMVLVLAIVGILASIVAPLVITALTRAREATLQQDLKTMRKLIDDYYGDKGAFPPSLQALVTQGYLRAIPRDPVNGNKAEWKTVLAKEGGISDVRSLSNERGANGTPYADW